MKLTIINLFKKTVNGHIFRGKSRLVKPVTKNAMDKLMMDFQVQEYNMQLLRHPYLSIVKQYAPQAKLNFVLQLSKDFLQLAESSGHAKALQKREKLLQKWKEDKLVMKPHISIESRINHLKIKEVWD